MMKNEGFAYALTLVAALGLAVPSGAQPTSTPAADNAKQLQSTLSLDRDTYFSGEAALFTLTVRNPASTALAVPTPFSAANGCFALSRRLDGSAPTPLSAKPVCPFRSMEADRAGTTILASGEERQATLSSDTLISALPSWVRKGGTGVFSRPGYYQVEYLDQTPRPSAVFRVVAPHLEAAAVVKLSDVTFVDPAAGQRVYVPVYRHVFAVRWNNQSFICVSQAPDSRDRAVSADGHGDYAGSDFPYVRIAATAVPVTSITATADAQDRLTIEWQDSSLHRHIKLLGSASTDPVGGAVQIGLNSTFEKLNAAEARQFSATVLGSSNTNLNWTVSLAPGSPAGSQPGTVSPSGVYSAPAKVNRPYRVILTARSQADESSSAVAVVSLSPQTVVTTTADTADPESKVPGLASSLGTSAMKPESGLPFRDR